MNAQWGCITKAGTHGLRRGSWYLVTGRAAGMFAIEVDGRTVHVPEDALHLRRGRPISWTIVHEDSAPLHFGGVYGVCPNCVARAGLRGYEETLACPACGFEFRVNWHGRRVGPPTLSFAADEAMSI